MSEVQSVASRLSLLSVHHRLGSEVCLRVASEASRIGDPLARFESLAVAELVGIGTGLWSVAFPLLCGVKSYLIGLLAVLLDNHPILDNLYLVCESDELGYLKLNVRTDDFNNRRSHTVRLVIDPSLREISGLDRNLLVHTDLG